MAEALVVRWYTKARRIPILLGRTNDGTKIPGGPYTLPQVVAAGGVLFALWKTSDLWARFGPAGNAVIFVAVLVGSVIAVGKMPRTGRNPLSWAADFLALQMRAPGGRIDHRPVRVRRPHTLRARVIAPHSPGPQPPAAVEPEPNPTEPVPEPVPEPKAAVPVPVSERAAVQLTGVGRLLAGATMKED